MHVFLKFAFMITLNFVYYYLCIIEIECTLFFYESTSFHSDIYFMVRNEDFSSLKKAIKGKKNKTQKEIKNNFPKLTYKDWDFFFFFL